MSDIKDTTDNRSRVDVETTVVAKSTRDVAKDGAGSAIEVVALNGILDILSIAQETGVGMGATPERYDTHTVERAEMHVGRVHRDHTIEMRHKSHLVG